MIRQFEVFENPDDVTRPEAPYLVVLQSHHLDALDTVIVAPLMRLKSSAAQSKVMVEVRFVSETLTANLTFLANIERALLRRRAGSLTDYEDDIRRALDRLFTGF